MPIITVDASTASVALRQRSRPTFGPDRLDAQDVVGALAELLLEARPDRLGRGRPSLARP